MAVLVEVLERGSVLVFSRSVSDSCERKSGSPCSSSSAETVGHFLAMIFARASVRISFFSLAMNS
jgi:hypothetical protein